MPILSMVVGRQRVLVAALVQWLIVVLLRVVAYVHAGLHYLLEIGLLVPEQRLVLTHLGLDGMSGGDPVQCRLHLPPEQVNRPPNPPIPDENALT